MPIDAIHVIKTEFLGTIFESCDPLIVKYLSVFIWNFWLISVGVTNGIFPFQNSFIFVLGVFPVIIFPIFFTIFLFHSPSNPLNLNFGRVNAD